MPHVVKQRDGRLEQANREGLLEIGERQQTFAQLRAVAKNQAPHAAELVGALAALDRAPGDGRMPAIEPVEVAQHRPDLVGRRIDDGRAHDPDHRLSPPNWRLRASKPPWKTPFPIAATSSASRSGAQSNSAVHSAKVRSPSVIGVRRSVAT